MLTQIHQDLWILKEPLYFLGIDFSRTMSIVRLEDSSLLVYAPFEPSPEVREAIDNIGKPSIVIAPNPHHNKNALRFLGYYPEARLYYAGDHYFMDQNLDSIFNKTLLRPGGNHPWRSQATDHCIQGMPLMNEYVLFHHASRTLLTANFLSYFKKANFCSRIFWRFAGLKVGALGQAKMFKASIRDKMAYNETVEDLCRLPIRRAVATQGDLVESFLIPNMANTLMA